jgi:hypothetical protein
MIRRRYTAALWIGGNLVFGARDLGMLSARSQPRHHRLRLPDRHRATVALRRLCFVSFFSIIAVGCLDYFFMEVASIENTTVLAALLVKSLAITGLMRRPQ